MGACEDRDRRVLAIGTAVSFVSLVCLGSLVGCDGYMHGAPAPLDGDQGAGTTGSGSGGSGGTSGGGQPSPETCAGTISPGETPLPRLTEAEYNNTVDALFPSLAIGDLAVSGDEKVGPFEANVVASVGGVIAEQYSVHAETVGERVVADLDAVTGCQASAPTEVFRGEAEAIGGSAGQAQGEYWNLWSVGTIETTVPIDADGDYEIAVVAYGDQGGPELPRMVVSVNGTQVQGFEVSATRDSPQTYRASVQLNAGTHLLSIGFTNDFHNPDTGADRNLLVDAMTVTGQRVVDSGDGCLEGYVVDLASRAYRRPLTAEERSRVIALYEAGKAEYGAAFGVRLVVEAVLQSPKFLYRFEYGEPAAGAEVVALTDHEMASRLSYFLWDSSPDQALREAAAAGELSTAEDVEAQARRMLDDPRARRAVNEAFLRWLDLDELRDLERDDEAFTPELRESFEAVTLAFIDEVVWEGDGRLSTLLTAPWAYVDRHTAPLYGVEPPAGDQMVRLELDGQRRLGLLTQPAVLARQGYGEVPLHRGLFVREAFFCVRPPPPPDELQNPPETYEGQSHRERAADRLAHPQCGQCHKYMDPLGLPFEQFDTLGRWRTEDAHGNPVTSTGAIHGTDVDQPVDSPAELARALAGSEEVRQCVARQWFRLAFSRDKAPADACTLQALEQALVQSNDNIRELLVAITTTDAFRHRLATAP